MIAPSKKRLTVHNRHNQATCLFQTTLHFLLVKPGSRSLYIALQNAQKLAFLQYKMQKLAPSPEGVSPPHTPHPLEPMVLGVPTYFLTN